MKLSIEYITNQGLQREHNEDSILVDDKLVSSTNMKEVEKIIIEKDKILCVVADGMGGHSMGEVASKYVLAKLKSFIIDIKDKATLVTKLHIIKNDLDSFAIKNPEYKNMGTVIAGVLVIKTKLLIFNIGDSRVYENNYGYIEQLTKDHSIVYSLFETSKIEYKDINKHPKKNIVTSAFIADSRQNLDDIFIKEIDVSSKIKEFLICSDGIWESMDILEIEKCFKSNNIMECLKVKTLNNGAEDNFSGIYMRIDYE